MITNLNAVRAIYRFEMNRAFRTIFQSIISPVISTALYFVVFGSAIGSHMAAINGVSYGAYIVPGLVMMSLLTQSISNASFGIYFPKFTGTIYEVLSAPVSYLEVTLAYVGAAASKAIMLGLIILCTAFFFVQLHIDIWADGFEKLQIIPLLVVTPLSFLGGSFYSIHMLPPFWQKVTLFNPVVYLISGFRWSFYGISDVSIGISLGMTLTFLAICIGIVAWIFKTGYRLKN
jgi:ABC-2 type transport system permease protein